MKIQAYAIQKKGGKAEPFSYERTLNENDVLVNITHCGIARGDIQAIDDDWGDTRFPLVLGHEIIGIVVDAGVNSNLKRGDRVGIGYQQEVCFECQFCKEGKEQFCVKQKVIAVDCYGGLAEQIIVDTRFAFKLPSQLDAAKSAPLLSSGLTVYSAIVSAELPKDSTVAVLGVGGLGQLAIQFLNKMGHAVSAFSHSPEKREMINQLGAEYVDSSALTRPESHSRKFDFIISTLNVDFDLDLYLRMLKPQGKLCLVAQSSKRLSLNAGLLYDYSQRTIYGNYTGSRKDMIDMLAFSAQHTIASIVEVIPFCKMNQGIELVRNGKVSVRIVLEQNRK